MQKPIKGGKKILRNKSKIQNKNKLAVKDQIIPRHKEKFAALNFKRQVKTRLPQLDCDYVDKLNDKDKAWLNAFLEETVITNFDHKGKKFYKSKKAKREFYNSNNARNRCMYTKAEAMHTIINTKNPNALSAIIDNTDKDTKNEIEDALIEAISTKRHDSNDLKRVNPFTGELIDEDEDRLIDGATGKFIKKKKLLKNS
jgi:hypothetical protein